MNRYFFYSVFMTMMVNVMAYVPNILISQRFEGAIMGCVLGVVISTILIYVFSCSLMKFPGMGLPEIFQKTIPSWMKTILLLFFALMWYAGAALVLITFSIIMKRFISPEMSLNMIIVLFMLTAGYTAFQSSRTQLYILEIVLSISAPFIMFIIVKALTSKQLMWDAIEPLKYYVWKFPSFTSIAASTYTFIGYINMAIFHREFNGKFNTKYFWVIPIFGLLNLFSTVAVPIGFHGTEGVVDYPFPWVTTSDSMRLELAFIERVIFPFLLVYVLISLLFSSIGWHVSIEMMKKVLPKPKADSKWKPFIPYITLILFMIPPILVIQRGSMPDIQLIDKFWINLRFISEVFLVGLLFFLSKWRRRVL